MKFDMKLNRQPPREPRISSRDALAVDAAEPKSEFFDPQVDFPAEELARLKKLASLPVHQTAELLHDPLNIGWWLKFVDPEFKELVENQEGFEVDLKESLDAYLNDKKRAPYNSMKSFPNEAVSVVQLFPRLRNALRTEHFDALLPGYLSKGTHYTLWERLRCFAPLLQLYPERRGEIMQVFRIRGEEVAGRIQAALDSTRKLGFFGEAEIVAHALLLFPDRRSEILAVISDEQRKRWVGAMNQYDVPYEHYVCEFALI